MKRTITLKTIIPASILLAACLAAPLALAQQVVLKVHHFMPATAHPHYGLVQPWCDKIAKESNNRMKCQVFTSMQLGGTPGQLFDQVRDGTVDIVWSVLTYASGRFNKSEVFELPWMTYNGASGSKAFWTYVQKNALDEFKGVKPIFLHLHDGMVLHFARKQPKTLEDMKGLKVRAPSRLGSRLLTALGATPVQMPMPQVPEAIAKGVVDGVAVPWEAAPSIKLQEITDYHLDGPKGSARMTNAVMMLGMNQARYDSLPPDLKKIIDNNSGLEMSAWAGAQFDEVAAPFEKVSRDHGDTFHYLPETEFRRWLKVGKTVDEDWVKEMNARGQDGQRLLEEAQALVKKYAEEDGIKTK